MVKYVAWAIAVQSALLTTCAVGQGHSDVAFSYVEGKIDVEPPNGSTDHVFESNFPTSGIEQQLATLPGFASETDVDLGIGAGDEIVYNVLEDLLYWDGTQFTEPPEDSIVRIANRPPSVPETLIGADTGEQSGSVSPPLNRIGAADDQGEFHVDLRWSLEPNDHPALPDPARFGAYGVKLTLSTSNASIEDSDPLLFAFNFGLNALAFEEAIDQFASLLTQGPLPGDFNGDGTVGPGDYSVWRNNLGSPEDPSILSGNGDGGVVGVSDYELWKKHFGSSSISSPGAGTVTIPEPSAGLLALVAMVGGCLLSGGPLGSRSRFFPPTQCKELPMV